MSKIAACVGTRSESAQAPVTYEIPDIVAEAIVNAVAHRDYTSNASVQVSCLPIGWKLPTLASFHAA